MSINRDKYANRKHINEPTHIVCFCLPVICNDAIYLDISDDLKERYEMTMNGGFINYNLNTEMLTTSRSGFLSQ